jgi:pyruvate/2-oxoglutarate dehydrogenase complex dihydrolipoamide acyltransferase (E2) component
MTAGHVVDLTPGRRAWLNALDLGGPAHRMYGLVEVDVTVARERIAAEKERTGVTLSFTGFLIGCLARAVSEHKQVQAYRKGRRQLVIFDDVDVGMLIEHREGLMAHVVRRADHLTCREIHEEIRAVQASDAPPARGMPPWLRRTLSLPWPLAPLVRAGLRAMGRNDPSTFTEMSGTTFISAVGMFGKGHSGWAISPTPHSLSVFVGGVARKPTVIGDQIVPRDLLDLTLLFDHDVVDGAPAARFTARLIELIEAGHGL